MAPHNYIVRHCHVCGFKFAFIRNFEKTQTMNNIQTDAKGRAKKVKAFVMLYQKRHIKNKVFNKLNVGGDKTCYPCLELYELLASAN